MVESESNTHIDGGVERCCVLLLVLLFSLRAKCQKLASRGRRLLTLRRSVWQVGRPYLGGTGADRRFCSPFLAAERVQLGLWSQ